MAGSIFRVKKGSRSEINFRGGFFCRDTAQRRPRSAVKNGGRSLTARRLFSIKSRTFFGCRFLGVLKPPRLDLASKVTGGVPRYRRPIFSYLPLSRRETKALHRSDWRSRPYCCWRTANRSPGDSSPHLQPRAIPNRRRREIRPPP